MDRLESRDYRIDFFRGLALIMIFINHIPGNLWGRFTNKNFGFSDSAEVFVLLAGYASAYAYYHKFLGGEPITTSIRVARRSGSLYIAHIVSSVLALALFCGASLILSRPELVHEVNIFPLIQDPIRGVVGLTILTHQLGYFNILPLYVVLLLMLPLVMRVYQRDWRYLLFFSFALYLFVGFMRINLPSFPEQNAWFFNPLSWQLLFVIGFIWGGRARTGALIRFNKYFFWVCVLYLLLALVWVQWPLWNYFPKFDGVGALWSFSKTYLSPFRLFHVVALAYVIGMSPLALWSKRVKPTNSIVQMGQHALPVFCTGSLLSMLFLIVRKELGGSLILDTTCVATGIFAQAMLAQYLSWQAKSPAAQLGSASASGFVAAAPALTTPASLQSRRY